VCASGGGGCDVGGSEVIFVLVAVAEVLVIQKQCANKEKKIPSTSLFAVLYQNPTFISRV